MAEPTTARSVLRRNIGRALGMPFYQYFSAAQTADAGSSTSSIIDSHLTQPDHFWEGSWCLVTKLAGVVAEESTEVVSFVQHSNRLNLDRSLTGLTTADEYELLSGWSAFEIHEAINRAIDSAFPFFFDTVTDETLVIKTDTMAYTISGLTTQPWKIQSVWIEQPGSTMRGQVSAAGDSTYLYASTSDNLSLVDTTWMVSCYDGTNAGEVRAVSTADNTTKKVTPTSVWTTAPDTTTMYMLWQAGAGAEFYDWKKIPAIRTDSKEWPSKMYMTQRYIENEGARIRIQYLAKPSSLTTDASTTIVPAEYITLKSVALLARMRVSNNRYDRARFSQMADDYEKQAEMFLRRNAWQPTPGTIWGEQDVTSGRSPVPDGDPMGWRS